MNQCFALLLLAEVVLTGCAGVRERQRRDFDYGFYWGTESQWNRPNVPAEDFCTNASDPARTRDYRSQAVFMLFGTFIKPGFTSREMRAAFPDTRWLGACRLEPHGGLGGQVDFDMDSGTPFILRVRPDEKGWSAWVVYFTLTGGSTKRLLTVEDARAFLTGTQTDKQVRLAEFVLCYPRDPHLAPPSFSERVTSRGVGLKVR